MSTTQKIQSIEPEATPPAPRRWKGAIAAIAVLVAAIATIVIMTADDATLSPAEQLVTDRLVASESVTDAFYSLSEGRLSDAIGDDLAVDRILGGQEVVSGRNTTVSNREPCAALGTSDQVACTVATDHDLAIALSYEGTETITLTFSDRDIIGADWEEVNLPDHVDAFWDWLIGTKPGFFDTNCEGPDDDTFSCAAALVQAAGEYRASDGYTGPPVP